MDLADEIVEKECTAKIDTSIKEVEDALPTDNHETPMKKYKNRIRERRTVDVSNEFDTCMSSVMNNLRILST